MQFRHFGGIVQSSNKHKKRPAAIMIFFHIIIIAENEQFVLEFIITQAYSAEINEINFRNSSFCGPTSVNNNNDTNSNSEHI